MLHHWSWLQYTAIQSVWDINPAQYEYAKTIVTCLVCKNLGCHDSSCVGDFRILNKKWAKSSLLDFISIFPAKSLPVVLVSSCTSTGWKHLWENWKLYFAWITLGLLTWVFWILPSNYPLNGSKMNIMHGLRKVHLPADLGTELSGRWVWRELKKSSNMSYYV